MGFSKRSREIHVRFLILSLSNDGSSVDEVAAGGKVEIRGDAESIGFNETFNLRIQAKLRKKAKTVATPRTEPKLSRRELEKMYVSMQQGSF